MTPDQQILRDALLAECWRPVPGWHSTKDERADADARNAILAEQRGEPELPFRGVA